MFRIEYKNTDFVGGHTIFTEDNGEVTVVYHRDTVYTDRGKIEHNNDEDIVVDSSRLDLDTFRVVTNQNVDDAYEALDCRIRHMILNGCKKEEAHAKILDISAKWDFSRLTTIPYLVWDLTYEFPRVDNWDVSRVTYMRLCSYTGLEGFMGDISKWDVRNVVNATQMLQNAWVTTDYLDNDVDLSTLKWDSLQIIDSMLLYSDITPEHIHKWGWVDQRPDLDWRKAFV